jgi:hypothetical protein
MLKKTSKFFNVNAKSRELFWWQQDDWDAKMNGKRSSFLTPFVLKYVDRQGYSCSKCNWTMKCSGCIVPPTTNELIIDFAKYPHLVIEWQS